jgi:hypothetical protein
MRNGWFPRGADAAAVASLVDSPSMAATPLTGLEAGGSIGRVPQPISTFDMQGVGEAMHMG